ncbi:HPF/RaiA family ribosome-associated protein [Ferruginibacter paludis]|uniref:HPF/RaiA family ribosome-associated protein n=1 Tax=Ferruginibacter paludis TaxID=1310417 RepID=UPI0025B476FE|nr:HPF/RaiA family ribosome-associated protein [Ferruginibacter paludis]MDN3657089.1 HPF/RaiA family ribosome-associated protein [Ferruginibacter paludis]
MDIIIQSLGFKAGESIEQFITEKMNGLKSETIIRANVTLFKGPDTNPENNYCEVRLEVPGNDLFVKKNSQYFETSVSECTDVLASMLNKAKDVSTDRRQAQTMEIQDALIAGDVNDEETELEDVVK